MKVRVRECMNFINKQTLDPKFIDSLWLLIKLKGGTICNCRDSTLIMLGVSLQFTVRSLHLAKL